jgi:hypothetical protein
MASAQAPILVIDFSAVAFSAPIGRVQAKRRLSSERLRDEHAYFEGERPVSRSGKHGRPERRRPGSASC